MNTHDLLIEINAEEHPPKALTTLANALVERELARSVAEAYYASRERLGFPMASRA